MLARRDRPHVVESDVRSESLERVFMRTRTGYGALRGSVDAAWVRSTNGEKQACQRVVGTVVCSVVGIPVGCRMGPSLGIDMSVIAIVEASSLSVRVIATQYATTYRRCRLCETRGLYRIDQLFHACPRQVKTRASNQTGKPIPLRRARYEACRAPVRQGKARSARPHHMG